MVDKHERIIGIAGTAAMLIIYGATAPSSLTWSHYGDDGGDLATAVALGSIPHPPGFPTYLLLGTLFIRLPWGEPAWRLNLMSAALAAGAVGLTMVTVRRLLQRMADNAQPSARIPAALTTGLCLGLAPLFWSQALITEVYATASFFAALVTALSVQEGPPWALGVSWGAGLGAHPTLIFLAPLVAWGAWGKRNGRALRLATVCLLALLGWGALYGPVLLARSGTPSPWGDVSTFAGWWALVSGQLYRGYLFKLPLADWPRRLLAWIGLLARQFTPAGAVLAGLGLVKSWRSQRPLGLALALAFGALGIYAIGYNTTDSLVYLAPMLPPAALWLGIGLAQAADWLNHRLPRAAWVLLLLPLLQALLFWGQMDLSGDRTAIDWAEQTLHQAPPQAVVLSDQDRYTFTLWYVHDVLGSRPDVTVIDVDLWGQKPYHGMMVNTLGLGAGENDLSPEEAVRQAGRPIVRAADLSGTEEESP
ncbi:MAG: DUF2723 domain-containing protein [Anaerolineae bacterium]|nr:DUF2723 domain-containing protein [Anaerolineae bacterium]